MYTVMKHVVIILLIPFLNACTAIGIDNGPISTLKLLTSPPHEEYSGRISTPWERYLYDLRHDQAKPIGYYQIQSSTGWVQNQKDLEDFRLRQMSRKKIHRHWVGGNGSTYTCYSYTYSGGRLDAHAWDPDLNVFRKKLWHQD